MSCKTVNPMPSPLGLQLPDTCIEPGTRVLGFEDHGTVSGAYNVIRSLQRISGKRGRGQTAAKMGFHLTHGVLLS